MKRAVKQKSFSLLLFSVASLGLLSCSSDLSCGDNRVSNALKKGWLASKDQDKEIAELKLLAPVTHDQFSSTYTLSLDAKQHASTDSKLECSVSTFISFDENTFQALKKFASNEVMDADKRRKVLAIIDKLRAEVESSRMFFYKLERRDERWFLVWIVTVPL